ncbi:hypothetical protein BZA77DRAFT_348784 [Pyronema omphalodes]|nr:hypothetical protein BZA77DRAFT_348784 [Pyronema omphalodes]
MSNHYKFPGTNLAGNTKTVPIPPSSTCYFSFHPYYAINKPRTGITTQAFIPTIEHKMLGDDGDWPYLEYEVGEVIEVLGRKGDTLLVQKVEVDGSVVGGWVWSGHVRDIGG